MLDTIQKVEAAIVELQAWFASRRPGFKDTASPQQLQQFKDREIELAHLIEHRNRLLV